MPIQGWLEILNLLRRAFGKPLGYLLRSGLREAGKKIRSPALRRRLKQTTAKDLASRLGEPSLAEWRKRRRDRGLCLSPRDRRRLPQLVRDRYPEDVDHLTREAERIVEHEFDLLGSGPVFLGERIDWHLDFKSGFRWDLRPSHRIKTYRVGSDSDIKVPWELSRCQHWVTLARAWLVFGDVRFAGEFQRQARSWIDENPVGLGVNWVCTMDVALRALSWIWALDLFSDAVLDEALCDDLLLCLYRHGLWIPENLEQGVVNDNHYLSDALGLVACGAFFADLPEGRRWLQQGSSILEREITSQSDENGVGIEASVAYHRLVVEIFLVGRRLCAAAGCPLSAEFDARLEKMFEFVHQYVTPEGLSPQVGDHDDGRALRLGTTDMRDHRYLLSSGGVIFSRPAWTRRAGRFWEDSLWLLGAEALDSYEALFERADDDPDRSFLSPDFAVVGNLRQYLFADIGPVGFKGFGGHGHNDCLSFEWHAGGRPLLTDSGAYLYTSSAHWRDLFRSTAFHNTIRVDRQEINRIVKGALWTLRDDALPARPRLFRHNGCDVLEGGHGGYRRLKDSVTVTRRWEVDRNAPHMVIRDRLDGCGDHCLEFFFHAAPNAESFRQEDGVVGFRWPDDTVLRIECDTSVALEWECQSGWFSPSYGVKVPRPVWTARVNTRLPLVVTWLLTSGSAA